MLPTNVITLETPHRDAADTLRRLFKEAVSVSETTNEAGMTTIVLQGPLHLFDTQAVAMWGGTVRLTLKGRDVPPEHDEGFYTMLGALSAADPALARLVTAPTVLYVERRDAAGDWQDAAEDFMRVIGGLQRLGGRRTEGGAAAR